MEEPVLVDKTVEESKQEIKKERIFKEKGYSEDAKTRIMLRYFYSQMNKKNQHNLIIIVGETGKGKSWAGLRTAEILDPTFTVDDVCFDVASFMDRINDPSTKRGKVLIMDEFGVTMGRRNWMKLDNKNMSFFLQTSRQKNHTYIFCVPDLSFVDIQAQKLVHWIIEMTTLSEGERTSYGKIKKVVNHPMSSKKEPYFQFPSLSFRGKRLKIKYMKFSTPSPKLRHKYEIKKAAFVHDLSIAVEKDAGKKFSKNPMDKLNDIQKKILDLINLGRSTQDICDNLFLEKKVLSYNKQRIRKLGIDV